MFGGLFNFNKNKKRAEERVNLEEQVTRNGPGQAERPERVNEIVDVVKRADEMIDANEQGDEPATFESLSAVPFRGGQVEERPREELRITEFAEQDPDNKNLRALADFLKTDMKIKTEMLALAPRPEDDHDEATRIEYVDGLDDGLKSMRLDFSKINRDFGFDDRATEDFFRARREGLAVGKYEAGVPQKLFQREFSDMRPEFIAEVEQESTGYTRYAPMMGGALVDKARTVNELLHAYHSQIMNSNDILQAIPPIAERNLPPGSLATLRGEPSPDAREILEAIPDDLYIGRTDIVAVGGHIIMMVRDRGHALMLNINRGDKQYEVNYHIPKVCNRKMVEALPGVSIVAHGADEAFDGANGAFDIPYGDALGEVIVDFISRVPTDDDLELKSDPRAEIRTIPPREH